MHFNYAKSAKTSNSKVYRVSSTSNQKHRINHARNVKIKNKEGKMLSENPYLKEYYKTSNDFFSDKEYNDNYSDYYNFNENVINYNKDMNRNYIKFDYINEYNRYIPNRMNRKYVYNEYSNISSNFKNSNFNRNYFEIKRNNKNNEFFEDNSGYSDNNYNYNYSEYCESENPNDNKLLIQKFPTFKNNRFQRNINIYSSPMSQQSKKKRNYMNKVLNTDSNFSDDNKIKVKTIKKNIQNFGNRTTTTNNTYNNNIYYINPINVKHKAKDKFSPININRSFDNSAHQRGKNNSRDNYRSNKMDNSKYTNAAILIQSIFRGYLIKTKIYNYITMCLSCDKGLEIIDHLFLRKKKKLFNIFKNKLNSKFFLDESLSSSYYHKNLMSRMKKDNIKKELLIKSYNNEIRDKPYRNMNKNLNEKKFKSTLDDVLEENNLLKIQLYDLKNNEEALNNLIEENKKLKSINEIILKDNHQLSQKLKYIEESKNYNLIIDNQSNFYICQDMNKKNEEYVHKLKKFMADKLVYKKFNNNNNLVDEKLNRQKYSNNKCIEGDLKKEIPIKNLINIILKLFKSKVNNFLWKLYKHSQGKKEKEIKELLLNHKFKKIIYRKEQENKKILRKIFFKFVVNNIIYDNERLKKTIIEDKKSTILKKIFNKYEKDVFLIYKVILEKWNLKSKIIGMKTAAKDKKKKRKEKKKIFKLLYKNDLSEKNNSLNNLNSKFSDVNIFRSLTSNPKINKEFVPNKLAKIMLNNSTNNIFNRLNNLIKDENDSENKEKIVNKRYMENKFFFNEKNKNIDDIKTDINNKNNHI